MAVRILGADRVLFGSDAPGRSFRAQMMKVTAASIREYEKQTILETNARKLFP